MVQLAFCHHAGDLSQRRRSARRAREKKQREALDSLRAAWQVGTSTAVIARVSNVLSVALPLGPMDDVQTETYACGDGEVLSVQYINAGANSLAIVPIDGEDRIFVNVLSASGARYVSGADVWWSKGDTAILENTLEDDSRDCAARQ